MDKERLGFIGIGIMGEPMTRNLLKAGYSVTIYTRTKAKAKKLLSEGATWADILWDAIDITVCKA